MALVVTKVNFIGYVIADSEYQDDPRKWQSNPEDLLTVLKECMSNSFECTMDVVDATGTIGCDCTECTCQPNPLMIQFNEPGESADSSVSYEKEVTVL